MTPEELMKLSTQSAEEALRLSADMLDANLVAGDQVHARGVSDALSKAAIDLVRNPTS